MPRPAQTDKICRDCRFIEGDYHSSFARCTNPVALAWLEESADINMVSGEPIMAPPHCGFLRVLPDSPCGPQGKLFEKAQGEPE